MRKGFHLYWEAWPPRAFLRICLLLLLRHLLDDIIIIINNDHHNHHLLLVPSEGSREIQSRASWRSEEMAVNGAKHIVAQPNWFVICILWWWWWCCWWLTFLLVGQLPKRFVVLLRPLCPSPIQGTCSFPSLSQGFLWNVQFAFWFSFGVSTHGASSVSFTCTVVFDFVLIKIVSGIWWLDFWC